VAVIEVISGAALAPVLAAVARLRITVFRDWPYLYDGSAAYEQAYLQTYIDAPGAAIVLARDGDNVVGASTCLPMIQAQQEVRAAFDAAGLALAEYLYFGESVLLPAYRGQGLGVAFFAAREAQARALGLPHTTFCAVQRPADHPLRPPGAKGLEAFWANRGYTPRPELMCRMAWRDIGDADETEKPLMFWTRAL
jgi:GNAT superfamily N-acetyltransferase